MRKAGRFTAALLLVTVGVLLLLDQANQTELLSSAYHLWPLIIIGIGLEYIVLSVIYRNEPKSLRLDIGGMLLSLIISIAVIGFIQPQSLPSRFVNNIFTHVGSTFSSNSGISFDKGITKVPLHTNTTKLVLTNPNGSVVIRQGDVDHIEIHTIVLVDKMSKEEAQPIADASTIEFSGDDALTITAKGKLYGTGIKRKPRMNLTITLPQQALNMEYKLTNGAFDATGISLREQLEVQSTNGGMTLTDMKGNMILDSTNGDLVVTGLEGNVTAATTNGGIQLTRIQGEAEADTTNGTIVIDQVSGKLNADTTNGDINIVEVKDEVKADTTNGAIEVNSANVGGDWDLDSTHGSIDLTLPKNGNFSLEGSTSHGSIESEFPFNKTNKKITGSLGSGKYRIHLETTHDDIRIYKWIRTPPEE